MSDGSGTTHASLSRIASALGVNVDRFFDTDGPDQATALECLELLQQIRSENGMRRVVDCLRRIVREEQAADPSGL